MLSAEHCLRQVQENKQIIINEEGSKEEERQEDASVIFIFLFFVKNVYADLKRK